MKVIGELTHHSLIDCSSKFIEFIDESVWGEPNKHYESIITVKIGILKMNKLWGNPIVFHAIWGYPKILAIWDRKSATLVKSEARIAVNIIVRQTKIEFMRSESFQYFAIFLVKPIVLDIATIVIVDCKNCEHCDNFDQIIWLYLYL